MPAGIDVSSIADIVRDPCWFPATLDPRQGVLEFVRVRREDLAHEAFLDSRWNRVSLSRKPISLAEISSCGAVTAGPCDLNFIWHTAFCSSTALSRALDAPTTCLGLREPDILTMLSDIKRAGGSEQPLSPDLAGLTFLLLARRFESGETIVAKPSNIANLLLPEAAALTGGKSLMLFSDCQSFLVAVLRGGEERRAHVRRVFEKIVGDHTKGRQWPVEKLFSLTDLQVAAMTWHLQIGELARGMAQLGEARSASLDCDAYLADPKRVLESVGRFFALDNKSAPSTNDECFAEHAKTGSPFRLSERREEWRNLDAELRAEIQRVTEWLYATFGIRSGEPPLPHPLVRAEKSYPAR
jgi:hypothetical protein